VHAGKKAEAARLVPEMKRLATALENDTTDMKYSSSHASAPNGLVASYAAKAYERLLNTLEPKGGG
jgi:hypothetical protein